MERIYDIVIIGGGPGGYTAALYAARAGLTTLVLERLSAGGQMAQSDRIENYPGFGEGIDGFRLGEKMRAGAEQFGAETKFAEIKSVSLDGDIKVVCAGNECYRGRVLIAATGARPRRLGLKGEEELAGRGVHYCASCDGMFYRGKTVVVAGGGNSAAADALTLSNLAKNVIIVHRRDSLRAEKAIQKKLQQAENVELCWNSQITGLLVNERFRGVKLKDVSTGEERELSCDGLFVSIGREPASEIFQGLLEVDDKGYIRSDESTVTNIPGIFAIGDVRIKEVRQIITAAADGAVAVHHAQVYLANTEK